MCILSPLLLCLGMPLSAEPAPSPAAGVPQLLELLQDRQQPRGQSQAALLLVQSDAPEAAEAVRRGLRQTDAPEVFLALAAAVRLCQDDRFTEELVAAVADGRPGVRQAAAETLAVLPDADAVTELRRLAEDPKVELPVRQTALGALGRSGRRAAAMALLERLADADEAMRRAAADALTDLTGQAYGTDVARWRRWWENHGDITDERWLEERLALQTSRARRLEGDLARTREQVVRLHQQLHARLPAADRLAHVQALGEHEDAAVRALAVAWAAELLPGADVPGQRGVADLLLRLSRDGAAEVQKAAVLALGKVNDPRAFDRLGDLLRQAPAPVRAAAARALAQQARGPAPEAAARQAQVVPALQKALDDPALEVVLEAAEDLGALGVPEAGPVLAALLRHPSGPVRQTAAQALERVADLAVLDSLLAALDDPAVTVRFSLLGAVGHAAGEGRALTEAQRGQLVARLEGVLVHDADAGVRSRAASVLGECGPPAALPVLWGRVTAAEDSRVQEKAWGALVEIVVRAGSVELLQQWDRTLAAAGQGPRRLQLLAEVCDRWQKREGAKPLATAAQEALVQAQLEQGKWAAALPAVRELLGKADTDAEVDRRLRWLLAVGEQALKEGNRPEAVRASQDARPYLARSKTLAAEFARLEKQARAGE